jgi:hypothetical protein
VSRSFCRSPGSPGIYVQDGAYHAGFREPGSGRRRLRKLQASTLRAARKERESHLAALREGRLAARSEITLGALCDEWLATRHGRVADATYVYDEMQVKRITRVLGDLRLQAITVSDVRPAPRDGAAGRVDPVRHAAHAPPRC